MDRWASSSGQRDLVAMPPVCILAGGLGSRLGQRVRDVPKPLLDVAGEPFLVHQLRLLAASAIREVVICVGYRGEMIETRIGEELFGMQIRYSYDSPALDGTLGAVRRALPLLGERFLVLYGDTFLPINYQAVELSWRRSGCPAIMTVLRNEGRWDASNVIYSDGWIRRYDKCHPTLEMAWIDYGLGGLRADVVQGSRTSEADLAGLYSELAKNGELAGFEVTERFYEIGTPRGLAETDGFIRAITAPSRQDDG